VVAAHPDDEVLGVGGTLRLLSATGVRLRLVAVTDGEGSHPRSTALSRAELRVRRIAETRAALDRLGVDAEVIRLELPDAGLAPHRQEITSALGDMIAGADACMAPWRCDEHTDHETCGAAADAACRARATRLLEYPIWAWHWSSPGDLEVPWDRAAQVPLPVAVQDRKRAAVACFVSQIRPLGPLPGDAAILPPETLAHFDRPREVLFG
jgi:LmbE family N-acetylglucosaminyl deacetylase